MPKPAHDEAILVECAIAGDADAFGNLYLKHIDAIFRYVFYRTGEVEDAEDLTEQVFLKAWEALPNYRRFGFPFTSWLYRIAHNVVVDYHRAHKLIQSEPLENQNDYVSGEDEQGHTLKRIIELEESAALVKAISKLPEEQQQVLVLRFVEGMSHSEIANIIDKSEGACRMIQHRALSALNGSLKYIQE